MATQCTSNAFRWRAWDAVKWLPSSTAGASLPMAVPCC